MDPIKLELTIDETNLILRTLGKHPFEEVVALINKIKGQGEPQVLAAQAAQEKAAAAATPVEAE